MTWETVEKFTCDRCARVFEAPHQTSELPPGWTRFDLFNGDEKGTAQDGPTSGVWDPFFHYCAECAPGVLQLLRSIRLDPDKAPVDGSSDNDSRRRRKGKRGETQSE